MNHVCRIIHRNLWVLSH